MKLPKKPLEQAAKWCFSKKPLEFLYNKYSEQTSKFLTHGVALGWIFAGIANVMGIAMDKKLEKKEKKYLIPQQATDAITNIGLFYIITNTIMRLTSKAVDNKKIVFEGINTGSKKFQYAKNGLGICASLLGTVISSNILTPIIRSRVGAQFQKSSLKSSEKKGTAPALAHPYYTQKIKPMDINSFITSTKSSGMRV